MRTRPIPEGIVNGLDEQFDKKPDRLNYQGKPMNEGSLVLRTLWNVFTSEVFTGQGARHGIGSPVSGLRPWHDLHVSDGIFALRHRFRTFPDMILYESSIKDYFDKQPKCLNDQGYQVQYDVPVLRTLVIISPPWGSQDKEPDTGLGVPYRASFPCIQRSKVFIRSCRPWS